MAANFVLASNNRIEIAGLSDYTTSITLSAWVRPASDPTDAQFFTIFSKAKTGSDRNIDIDYRKRAGVLNIEITWTQPTSSFIEWVPNVGVGLTLNTWHHVALAVDWTTNPDTVVLLADGVGQAMVQVGSSNNATPTTGTPALNRIGSIVDAPNNSWDGDIAELAVWPGLSLTVAEMFSLSKGFAPFVVHPAGLELYTPLVRNLFDYKGPLALTNQGTTPAFHSPVIYGG